MRTLLYFMMLSLLVLASERASAIESFVVPTPLDRAKDLVTSGKPEDALEALSSYLPSREELSDYHYAYAQALVQLDQPYESIEHYRLAYLYVSSAEDKERMLVERAEVYAAMGYYSEAVVCFDVFFRLYPKSGLSARAELGIAEARYRLGDFREALVHFEKAGTSLRARYGKANVLQALSRTKEAYDIYHELIESDPEIINSSQETLYNIGENFRKLGKMSDAKVYLTSVKDDSFKYRAAISLGQIALREGQREAAVNYFTTAAGSPERLVRREAIMDRADVYMRLGKYDEAQAALLEIKNSYPYGKQYDAAALLLAKLYRERGTFGESVALLKTLIYRRTPSSAALDELEAIMIEAKERDPAAFAKLWKDAGRWLLDPSRSASLMKMARGLRHAGKPFLDICAWLIRYGHENAKSEGRLLLADFYADMGDAPTAWGYLKRSRIKGHSDDVLRVKAKVYRADHDPMNASQTLMQVRELREDDMLMLLDSVKSLKNAGPAVVFCKRTFAKTPATAKVIVSFADLLYNRDRTGEALEYYQAAVATVNPGAKMSVMAADLAWAHYQISVLARGEEALASLKAIQAEKNALGRFAAAELQRNTLRRKIE